MMMPQRTAEPDLRHFRGLPPLLSSCAMGLALAAALQGGSARAQAFQGTPTVVAGSATITTGTGATNVAVSAPSAVIDWTPTDTAAGATPIDFLPAGSVATFTSATDFTVLNRILPSTTRSVGLNGSVVSTINASGLPQTGGNVWFYSPTGIVAGSSSSFTTGGLILTADDILFTPGPSGGIDYSFSGAIQFRGTAGSQAGVVIQPGATITASSPGGDAYVALVAPRVQQDGTIQLDGSVGLVAAEEADIRINGGLFDIQMLTGTTVPDAITHTGVTGEVPASATVTGPQKVYVAALPKNTAITMLLSGTLGASAASASAADRAVILSGGYSVFDASGFGISSFSNSTSPVNVQITTAAGSGTDFAANLTASTSGTLTANPQSGQSILFEENASLSAVNGVTLTADLDESLQANGSLSLISPATAAIVLHSGSTGNAATLTVAGDLLISASNTARNSGASATGGLASLQLDAGAVGPIVTVNGLTTIEADGSGLESSGAGGDGFGGTAQILMNGGTLTLGGTEIHANGLGSSALFFGDGGAGAGGTAEFVQTGGVATVSGLTISANGQGGAGDGGGANGNVQPTPLHPAIARLSASGTGTELDAGYVSMSADATVLAGSGQSGSSIAGTVEIQAKDGALLSSASGISGSATAGWILVDSASHSSAGTTQGGSVLITVAGGTLDLPDAFFSADATALYTSGAQGDAIGGTVTLDVTDSPAGEGLARFTNGFVAAANATGALGATGGNATGGSVSVLANGGTIDAGGPNSYIFIEAVGQAGITPSAGVTGTGGTVTIETAAGGAQAGFAFQNLQIDASGSAGFNDSESGPSSAGDGGTGQGGSITINALGGSLTGGTIDAVLTGTGGNAAVSDSASALTIGGNGHGGTFGLTLGGGILDVGTISADASGSGGYAIGVPIDSSGFAGIPGNGSGGTITIAANGGTFTNQTLSLNASGYGGLAGDGFDSVTGSPSGGSGTGGTATITLGGASFTTLGGSIHANGFGGDGSELSATPGGSGTGGTASIVAADATSYALGDLTVRADGIAGNSTGTPSAADGTGTGGSVAFVNQGAAPSTPGGRTVGRLMLSANGDGGTVGGQPGQNAVGGFVRYADLATGTNGRVSAVSVSGSAQGLSAPAGNSVLIESAGGPTTADDYFDFDAVGSIEVAVDGGSTISAGGDVRLFSSAGGITVGHANQTSPLSPTIAGSNVTLDASQDIAADAATLIAANDQLLLRARNGSITAGSLTAANALDVHALGDVTLINASTTGAVTTLSGGSLGGGGIYITAGLDPLDFVPPYLPADVIINGNISASGELRIHAGRDILSGDPLIQGQMVELIAQRDISGSDLSVTSSGDLNIYLGRNLLLNTVDVAGTINMIDPSGNLVQSGVLDVPGSLTLAGLVLRGPTPALLRSTGDLTVIGPVQASGLDAASTGGALRIGGLSAFPGGPSAFLTASAPTVSLGTISVSGAITATATGGVGLENGQAGGAITLTSSGGNAHIGRAQAGGVLSVQVPGTITVDTLASGTTVGMTSGDLVIAPGGRIGTAGTTTLIELTNSDDTRVSYFGDPVGNTGYSLSTAELGQLFADDITLIAPQTSTSAPYDVVVGAIDLTSRAGNSAGQLGPQGAFTIQTGGRVLVRGTVSLTGAGSGNSFAIHAGDRIVLDNQLGSIGLRGSNNALAGTIDLSAARIMAVSSSTLDKLTSLTDAAVIDALLAVNDGRVNDQGVLRAGALRFSVGNGLYIQNTGAGTYYDQRRGFAAGPGGVTISTDTKGAPAIVVINGQATSSAGRSAFGRSTIPLVTINGKPAPDSSGTAPGSTINGCVFLDVASCTLLPSPILPNELVPSRDRIETPVESPSDPTVYQRPEVTPVQIQDIGRFGYEPLIDEPVTGSGNDDLWTADCDPGAPGGCPQPPAPSSESGTSPP